MPKGKNIMQTIFNAAIFILMEIAALNMLNHNGILQNFLISKQVHSFMGKVWGGSESIKYYFSLKNANESLAQENFELIEKIKSYEALVNNGHIDTSLNQFADSIGFKYIPATVVKVSKNKQHNYLILGQGSAEGIRPQSGIITSKGVIGIVDAVSKHYSYAISLMNTNMSISARLNHEGAVGPLVWNGKNPYNTVLKAIPLQFKFQPGDTVYTSGHSSIFPPDIPLGVTGNAKIVNGATRNINVRLFQDPGSVRYVIVVNNSGRDEIESLEKQTGGE